jgi:ArsR family transcriptional regulator, virulence genes transcriptional regulator
VGGSPADMQELEQSAAEVAPILRALGNERRLMIVCKLVEWGEANVISLAEAVAYRNRLCRSISRS